MTASDPEPAVARPQWFRVALALVVVGALILRVAYVLLARRNFDPHGDAYFYTAGANLLADGKGFISPFFEVVGIHRPAAEHPPLYIVFLAIPSVLGMKSVLTHLLWSCGLGSATVWVIGLLGRAVGGARVGIVAAFIAAVYPNLWAPDGQLQAETLSMFFAALALLLAYRYRQSPSWQRLTLVGLGCGAGAMARSELILLVPFLVLPLVLTTRSRPGRERLQWLGVSVLAAVVVIAPWTIYNTTRFVHPVLLSAQFDPLLASANCESVYYGRLQGYFDIQCAIAISDREHLADEEGLPRFDESQEDVVYRREALSYIRGHLGRLPNVEGVRLLRIAGLYKTSLYVRADAFIEGRNPVWISWAALYTFWLLALLSIGGGVVMRRRRVVPVWPLITPIVVVLVTVVITYASTRFRTTAEPVFVVLAAVALDAAVDAAIRRMLGRARTTPNEPA